MQISKSYFLKYQICPSYLWLWKNKRDVVPVDEEEVIKRRLEQGNEVERYARQLFPDAKLVESSGITAKRDTERLVSEGETTIFQATVKIVETYKCLNINTQKFEHLIHRFFGDVKLDMPLTAPNGTSYIPSEWYVVPLDVLNRTINLIISGEIVHYRYDSGLRDIVLVDD